MSFSRCSASEVLVLFLYPVFSFTHFWCHPRILLLSICHHAPVIEFLLLVILTFICPSSFTIGFIKHLESFNHTVSYWPHPYTRSHPWPRSDIRLLSKPTWTYKIFLSLITRLSFSVHPLPSQSCSFNPNSAQQFHQAFFTTFNQSDLWRKTKGPILHPADGAWRMAQW